MPPSRKFMLCIGEVVSVERLADYPRSHIIGELRYLTDESRKVTALAQYEYSRATDACPDDMPLIRCYSIGDTREIRCTECENRARWEAGPAAIKVIIDRARKNGVNL